MSLTFPVLNELLLDEIYNIKQTMNNREILSSRITEIEKKLDTLQNVYNNLNKDEQTKELNTNIPHTNIINLEERMKKIECLLLQNTEQNTKMSHKIETFISIISDKINEQYTRTSLIMEDLEQIKNKTYEKHYSNKSTINNTNYKKSSLTKKSMDYKNTNEWTTVSRKKNKH